jgi:hypothetical protein
MRDFDHFWRIEEEKFVKLSSHACVRKVTPLRPCPDEPSRWQACARKVTPLRQFPKKIDVHKPHVLRCYG